MIGRIRFTPSCDADADRGLLAFVKLEFGLLVLDGLTLRRHANGQLGISYPERTDRAGRRHALIHPIDDAARRELEHAVLLELTRQELEADRANAPEERKP